jgi:signal transduction histidine kinase
MSRLIRDLLDVSTIGNGGLVMVPEEIDVCALLRDTLQSFEGPAAAKGIELSAEPLESLPAVRADPGRLMQVLSNVVGNAVKFTPAGGTVRLCARIHDEYITISVSDTGPGIPADSLAHIFDRFWQARRTQRAGAGLGLAIARGIVEAHGGRIWAESELGKGATVSFSVPIHSREQQSVAR